MFVSCIEYVFYIGKALVSKIVTYAYWTFYIQKTKYIRIYIYYKLHVICVSATRQSNLLYIQSYLIVYQVYMYVCVCMYVLIVYLCNAKKTNTYIIISYIINNNSFLCIFAGFRPTLLKWSSNTLSSTIQSNQLKWMAF